MYLTILIIFWGRACTLILEMMSKNIFGLSCIYSYIMPLQSFSLRRTVTPRQMVMPTPATNVSVTAILEKANAIRQVIYMSSLLSFPAFFFPFSVLCAILTRFPTEKCCQAVGSDDGEDDDNWSDTWVSLDVVEVVASPWEAVTVVVLDLKFDESLLIYIYMWIIWVPLCN